MQVRGKGTVKAVELFAGAGGMSQGAINEGLTLLAAFDNWAPAVETYSANFTHGATELDLADEPTVLAALDAHSADIVLGGPPCQDFSNAGNRSEGARAGLTTTFARYVSHMRPTAFIMENVPAALRSAAYAEARAVFELDDYGITELILNASLYGVPQNRKRAFVIGIRGAEHDSVRGLIQSEQSVFPLSVRRGVSALPVEHYYRHPRSYDRRAVFSIDEPSPTVRGTNRPRPATYRYHPNDSTDDIWVRSLTSSERSQIQTFPTSFKWIGPSSTVEQMIGNAAPPKLVQAVVRATVRRLSGTYSEPKSLIDVLAEETGNSLRFQQTLKAGRRLHRAVPLGASETASTYRDRVKNHVQYGGLPLSDKAKVDLLLGIQVQHEKIGV
ncbi:hypothetical protein GCM10027421_12310 [Microbacterium shaanxiense]